MNIFPGTSPLPTCVARAPETSSSPTQTVIVPSTSARNPEVGSYTETQLLATQPADLEYAGDLSDIDEDTLLRSDFSDYAGKFGKEWAITPPPLITGLVFNLCLNDSRL